MSYKYGAVILILTGLFSLYTAWSSGARPDKFAEALGLKVINAGGVNEIRSQYAGFFLAGALACLAALLGWIPRQTAYVVFILLFGGLIGGRVVSLALNGGMAGYPRTIIALYAIDCLGFLAAVSAFVIDTTGRA